MEKLLPVPYFLVTYTIPAELRPVAWKVQRKFFNGMFASSAKALRLLAANEKFLGGEIGMTGVLHTHSRQLAFHPHIHYVIPAGAIDPKLRAWKRKDWHYLFPEKALARLFRQELFAFLKTSKIELPKKTPRKKDWVVHCKEVGSGGPALKYLSRYLYRGIISEKKSYPTKMES